MFVSLLVVITAAILICTVDTYINFYISRRNLRQKSKILSCMNSESPLSRILERHLFCLSKVRTLI